MEIELGEIRTDGAFERHLFKVFEAITWALLVCVLRRFVSFYLLDSTSTSIDCVRDSDTGIVWGI